MPVPPAMEKDPAITGPLGGLALSSVRAASPMMVVRALRWYRDLARLGMDVCASGVVHDRRQGPVEVEPDDGPRSHADQVRVALFTLDRRELHASRQPCVPTSRGGRPVK